MRRTAAVLVSVVLAGALGSGTARGESFDDDPRTSTAAYLATGGPSGAPSVYWPDSPAGNLGGVELHVREGEHFVSVTVHDDSGVPVHGEIAADLDGIEQTSEMIADFCGSTHAPVELPDVDSIRIILRTGSCGGGPALATSGRVRVDFFKLP
jgi:hypothetical protein